MMQHVAHRHSDEMHQLRLENERLRAALMEICDMCPATADYTVAHEMAQVAGDALNGESVDSGKQGQKDE